MKVSIACSKPQIAASRPARISLTAAGNGDSLAPQSVDLFAEVALPKILLSHEVAAANEMLAPKAEAFQIVAQFFIIHVCPFRAVFPEKGAKKEGRLSSIRKTALLLISLFRWFERLPARNQFKELLLLRRIAARRAPSGKECSADDVIERLMRFVCLGSLQKSVQRLFKFVAHHALSPHKFGIYSFCVVFYHDFLQNTT